MFKCKTCGFECCPLCAEEGRDTQPEHKHDYVALQCFEQEEFERLYQFAQYWSKKPVWEPQCAVPKAILQTFLQPSVMYRISRKSLNNDTFLYFLNRGVPFVVTDVSTQLNWNPSSMVAHFGDLGCLIEDAAGIHGGRRGTVGEFYAPWISNTMRPEEGLLMKKVRCSEVWNSLTTHEVCRISPQMHA